MGSKWSVPSSEVSVCPFPWLRPRIPANRGPASTGPSPGTLSTLTSWASMSHPRPSTGSGPGHPIHLPRPARPRLPLQPDAATMIVRMARLISYKLGAREDVEPSNEHNGHGGDGDCTVAFAVLHGA